MRRKDKKIKDSVEIEIILKESKVGRIGLCHNNIPYIIPVNYAYENGFIYFHSATEGKKIDILEKNNKVCFEVDIVGETRTESFACKSTQDYKSVIGFGEAHIIYNENEKLKGLNLLMEKYSKQPLAPWDYSEKVFSQIVIIKIVLDEITGKKSGIK